MNATFVTSPVIDFFTCHGNDNVIVNIYYLFNTLQMLQKRKILFAQVNISHVVYLFTTSMFAGFKLLLVHFIYSLYVGVLLFFCQPFIIIVANITTTERWCARMLIILYLILVWWTYCFFFCMPFFQISFALKFKQSICYESKNWIQATTQLHNASAGGEKAKKN